MEKSFAILNAALNMYGEIAKLKIMDENSHETTKIAILSSIQSTIAAKHMDESAVTSAINSELKCYDAFLGKRVLLDERMNASFTEEGSSFNQATPKSKPPQKATRSKSTKLASRNELEKYYTTSSKEIITSVKTLENESQTAKEEPVNEPKASEIPEKSNPIYDTLRSLNQHDPTNIDPYCEYRYPYTDLEVKLLEQRFFRCNMEYSDQPNIVRPADLRMLKLFCMSSGTVVRIRKTLPYDPEKDSTFFSLLGRCFQGTTADRVEPGEIFGINYCNSSDFINTYGNFRFMKNRWTLERAGNISTPDAIGFSAISGELVPLEIKTTASDYKGQKCSGIKQLQHSIDVLGSSFGILLILVAGEDAVLTPRKPIVVKKGISSEAVQCNVVKAQTQKDFNRFLKVLGNVGREEFIKQSMNLHSAYGTALAAHPHFVKGKILFDEEALELILDSIHVEGPFWQALKIESRKENLRGVEFDPADAKEKLKNACKATGVLIVGSSAYYEMHESARGFSKVI